MPENRATTSGAITCLTTEWMPSAPMTTSAVTGDAPPALLVNVSVASRSPCATAMQR